LGRTEMSKRELGRVEVLARVRNKQLGVVDAARLMRRAVRADASGGAFGALDDWG
jgi:hypothetical protein